MKGDFSCYDFGYLLPLQQFVDLLKVVRKCFQLIEALSMGKPVLTYRRKIVFFSLLSYLILFLCPPSHAMGTVRLKKVRVRGNVRVEVDGIQLHLKVRAGDLIDAAAIDRDVKAIYRMGFFDDVKADLSPDGILTYVVREKPYVREIRIRGNAQVTRDKINTALGIQPRVIMDRTKVVEGVERVKRLYREQGYVNAQVAFAIQLLDNNQAMVQVEIDEGRRLLIQKISFEGNHAFSDGELKGLMATKEKWLLSFVTNRGVLDRDVLTNDLAILASHYYDDGYINHKIDEPVILRHRAGIEVVIRIQEGDQFRVGKVEIGGDLIEDGHKLLEKVKLTTGQIFRGSRLRGDISTLSKFYSSKGFAFVKIDPLTKMNPGKKDVDIALVVKRGPPVHFNRIIVAGNTKTRDHVIRRELRAAEGELFSGKRITESRNALRRTGYFSGVELKTKKSSRPGAVDLLVDVKEGKTGTFSIGGGYSGADNFVASASVTEGNLFGRGQKVNASFSLGTQQQDFVLGFTEPYFRDTPLSLGVSAFNSRTDFTTFSSRRTGFGTTTSYPIKYLGLPFLKPIRRDPASDSSEKQYSPFIEHMRGGVGYQLAREKINNFDDDTPESIRAEKGSSTTSSITPMLSYDSRDQVFNPTEGTKSSLEIKYAGLGGENRFLKTDVRVRRYLPLLNDPDWGGAYTLALGGNLGYGVGFERRVNGKKDLPIFERYFPGGAGSVRGFEARSLGPQDDGDSVGGDKQAILNAELFFPILEEHGLRGVAFFDTGQAFAESQSFNLSDFRRSVGVGGRWLSPFGPISIDLGFPLNKQSGDDTSVVSFSAGGQR